MRILLHGRHLSPTGERDCGLAALTGASVSGTIEIAGQPMPAGSVLFESEHVICVGAIKDGKFTMRYGDDDVIPVTDYRVSVCPPGVETRINPKTTRIEPVGKLDFKLYPTTKVLHGLARSWSMDFWNGCFLIDHIQNRNLLPNLVGQSVRQCLQF